MRRLTFLSVAILAATLLGADPKPELKITPGKAIVPLNNMRRIWGELIQVDLKSRTGTFRNESNDEVMSFTVLPYAELLHHATFGDLQDFRVGERAIFRLHPNEKGQWVWLTYIQDEMNFLNGHKEYYWVDNIEADKGRIHFTQANADKSYVREKGLVMHVDEQTRFWKDGKPAKFSDIQVDDRLRAKTHGIGKARVRMCLEVFLDDASLEKFRQEQQAVQSKRLGKEGMPGYIDERDGKQIKLTLFMEAREAARALKAGQPVRLAVAGSDRQPTTKPLAGVIDEVKPAGSLHQVRVRLGDDPPDSMRATAVLRLWPGDK